MIPKSELMRRLRERRKSEGRVAITIHPFVGSADPRHLERAKLWATAAAEDYLEVCRVRDELKTDLILPA
jgi:hypothetical protein